MDGEPTIGELLRVMNKRFDGVDKRLDKVDKRLDNLQGDMNSVLERLDWNDKAIKQRDQRVSVLEALILCHTPTS